MKLTNNKQSKLIVLAVVFCITTMCNATCLFMSAPLWLSLTVYCITIICWLFLLKVINETNII